jgi:prophage maintenance system killer protein
MVDYYNLDMIISVGYRVKSKRGIIFRKWANKVLKDYLLKGYAVNQKRLEYLEKTVKLIDIAGRIDYELKIEEAQGIIKVINNYSNALNILDDYDHGKLNKPKGTNSDSVIKYEDCIEVINKLRFNSDSNLFALERNKGLSSIINDIYQSFDGEDVYPSIEEKAVNFLYLITKNHTFIDGNKRIAATLFIYFLNFYNILYKNGVQVIDNNTLVAVTLLIAQSNPKEKDILVDLVMNFLK